MRGPAYDLVDVVYDGGTGKQVVIDPAQTPEKWLLEGAGRYTSTREVVRDLANLLQARGYPLLRVTCFIRTLHPQSTGSSVIWTRERPDPRAIRVLRGMEDTEAFRSSPLPVIFSGASAIRRRLDLPEERMDFPVLQDLKDAGATDYVAMPLVFSDGQANFVTWATDRPGGFTTEELTCLYSLLPVLALRVEVIERRQVTSKLLEVYLGRETGNRVLAGEILRGKVASIRAAVWYSDLKDFTSLSDSLERDELIQHLDAYFEVAVQAVEERGGEVLKFLGDGMLAIFPVSSNDEASSEEAESRGDREASKRALAAARDTVQVLRASNTRRLKKGLTPIEFGIALHLGEVSYGNIGGPERLDFTVIGPAVNLASRLEGLTRTLGVKVVASEAFRAVIEEPLTDLGAHSVKGLKQKVPVFAPSDLL